jgi:hypothetical protein
LTFSREAMGAFLVAILCACFGRILATPRLFITIFGAVLLLVVSDSIHALQDQGVITDENLERLTFQVSDASAKSHARMTEKVWEQFEAAPLIGNGFGTTAYWDDSQSHNLYLSFMADHGIIGVLLLPALLWSLAYRSWQYCGFFFAFLIWSSFNHNLFANPFGLITLALMANEQIQFRMSEESTRKLPFETARVAVSQGGIR